MRIFRTLSLMFLFVALGATSALAQQSSYTGGGHTLSSSALDAALAGHESVAEQQRAQLTDLLSRTEVKDVARDRGINMERVESAAAGLSDSQVRAVAPLVATVMGQDRGGLGTITISAVTLIVILLVLILVT